MRCKTIQGVLLAGIARKHALHHSLVQSPASTAIHRVVERPAQRAQVTSVGRSNL
jgi:hypothetical protein